MSYPTELEHWTNKTSCQQSQAYERNLYADRNKTEQLFSHLEGVQGMRPAAIKPLVTFFAIGR
jgi:hypothetical protein